MTRFIHDRFAKDYLEELLTPYGESPEIIMRLAPLYQQDREQAIQEGIQRGIGQVIEQGKRQLVENMLRVRFGSLDEEISAIIPLLLAVPPEEFSSLLLQLSNLSREELLARFSQ